MSQFWLPVPFEIKDLNQILVKKNPERYLGILLVCNMMNETWLSMSTHRWLLGDCLLMKLNLIKKQQVRVNRRRIKDIDEDTDAPRRRALANKMKRGAKQTPSRASKPLSTVSVKDRR